MHMVHAPSTSKGYRSNWRLFEGWCDERGVDPTRATSVLVCEFLLYLFNERKIQVRSIKGYRSALTWYLKRLSGYDLSECETLSNLVRSFERERPSAPRSEVSWDIATVLQYLRSPPFASDTVTPRLLTLKAVFLFCLAAGKRRSEVHALLRDTVSFAPDMSSLTVKPHPRFLSKTHMLGKDTGVLHAVTIPAIPDAPDAPLDLCPVRTLRHYVDVSDTYRASSQSRLFIAYSKKFGRDVSAQTISSYVKRTIREAHGAATSADGDAPAQPSNVKAHQVRHVSHSLAQLGAVPLTDVIRTGGWSTPSTFLKHYIQYLSQDTVDELREIGAFVAAGTVFESKPATQF